MSTRSLVIAGAILLCLVSYYAVFEMHSSREAQQEEDRGRRLLVFDKNDVIGIVIQGRSPVSLEKYGPVWQITRPVPSPADQEEVSNLISEISKWRIHRVLKEEGGLAQFGLDHPSLSIILRTAGREHTLSVGDKAPASDFYYAKTSAGSGVFLLSACERQYLIGQGLFALRDKHLVTGDLAKADRVRITRHSMIAEYVRDREGIWRLASDSTKRLKTSRVNELIREVCSIKALAYLENLAISRSPDIVIKLSSQGNAQEVKVWVQGDKIYSSSDAQKNLVEIDPSFGERMPEDPMEMLDRTMVSLDGEKVTGIVFSGLEKKTFTKNRDGWYVGNSKIKDPTSVNEFIKSMGMLEYQDEYLMLPRDTVRERGVRITCAGRSTPFDITVYSKYYVTVGKRIFRVNEGGMKMLIESVQSLLSEDA